MRKIARKLNLYFPFLVLVLMMFLIAVPGTALQGSPRKAEEHRPFAEYSASYRLHWHGLHVGKSIHTVRRLASNHYSAEAKSEPRLAIIPLKDFEKSEFRVLKNEMQPITYEFLSKERRKKYIGRLDFNWEDLTVTKTGDKGKTSSGSLPEKSHDMITQLFQVRQGLRQGQRTFDFVVFGPKGTKNYHYEVIGEEAIKTPVGTFKTLVVEHIAIEKEQRTRFWLAADLDYIMIRLIQIKKGKMTAEAMIESLNWL